MYILILGGGQWQEPIVRFFKNRGLQVFVVNPTVTATTKLADKHIEEDIRNFPQIIDKLSGYTPRLVTSDQSDIAVLPVTILSKILGTRANDIGSILLFTNKKVMGDFAISQSIPTPAFAEVKKLTDIDDFADKHGLPVVLKPFDANASKGFIKLDDLDNIKSLELHAKLEHTRSYSFIKKVIVQKYIDGEMLILDGICSGGKHRTLTHASNKLFRDGIISEVNYPSNFDQNLINEATRLNDKYVESSGLEFGITHAEYMVKGKDIYLLEIAARGGGFAISSHVLPWVSGVDVYDILFDGLVGKKVDVKGLKLCSRQARLKFYEYDLEKVTEITGVDISKKIPGVADFRMMIKVGDIKPATDGTNRHAFGLFLGDTQDEIDCATSMVERNVKVR